MKPKMFWILLAVVDVFILWLWVNTPAFFTWHGMAAVLLGGILGATFEDCWLK